MIASCPPLLIGLATLRAADSFPSPLSFTIGAFSFTRPPYWSWVTPASTMRKVQLASPGTKKDGSGAADVSFSYFGRGEGGSVQANVERWEKQFSSPDGSPIKAVTENRRVAMVRVTYVSARGLYSAGMTQDSPMPKPDWALRGAILESPEIGKTGAKFGDVFVKMTGPEQLVKEETPAFDSMVEKACRNADTGK